MIPPGGPGIAIPFGTMLSGDLRVFDALGATPEGPLYQAEYPDGRRVALLVLQSAGSGSERPKWERFSRATQIQHPSVAAVYAVGHLEDGSPYVLLEQLDGEPLLSSLAAGRRFAPGEALDIALQAAAGLVAAHQAGFIHGNLSPRTMLLTRPVYGKSQVKLIGFQLDPVNRQLTAPLDETSAAYASPERLGGSSLDERSDVFSLGAVLQHLLTGRAPPETRNSRAVPKVARAVLARSLAPAPEQRYQTMAGLHDALEQLISAAGRPKRSKALLLRAAAAGLALAAVGGWLLVGSNLTEPERPRTTAETGPAGQEAPPTDTRARPGNPSPGLASAERAARPARPEATTVERAGGRVTRPGEPVARAGAPRREPRSSTPIRADRAGETDRATQPAARKPSPPAPPAPGRSRRQANEPSDATEALGYVGGPTPETAPPPASSNVPRSTAVPAARPQPPAAAADTSPAARTREELEQHQGLRLAIEDVLRIGLAEEVAEVRPGLLLVSLAPRGMGVPSASYNIQRLYLAYSAATRAHDDIVLELRHAGGVYGRFTRQGMVPPTAE